MMDNLDGTKLNDFKQWECCKNSGHILGVIERVKVNGMNGSSYQYYATRLSIFRTAVDLSAEVPAEIEVLGVVDGKLLSMVLKCSVCGRMREWHPSVGAVELLQSLYGK